MTSSPVEQLSARSLREIVLRSSGLVVVDLSASWCPFCREFAEIFTQAAVEFQDHGRFGRIDVELHPEVLNALGIQTVPTVLIYSQGNLSAKLVGSCSLDDLRSTLNAHLPKP